LAPTGEAGAKALSAGTVASAVVSDRDDAAFQAEAAALGMAVQAAGRVQGFNYSRGRPTGLTLYKPAAAR
jgi:hypothetical protein